MAVTVPKLDLSGKVLLDNNSGLPLLFSHFCRVSLFGHRKHSTCPTMNMKLNRQEKHPTEETRTFILLSNKDSGESGGGGKESDVKLWINSGGSSASWVLN